VSFTIAVSGKGGTGKTTIAGFLVRYLLEKGKKPVLAVDADANSNLNEVLGVEVGSTIGEARDLMKRDVPVGMTKDVWFEYKIQEALVEKNGFDLIAMGRPEGPGCYCAANTLARKCIDLLAGNYPYVVIDNEAGMEHLSRRTTQKIDFLLLISDPSARGIRAAGKISKLLTELDTRVGKKLLILNRVKGSIPDILEKIIEEFGLDLFSSIPEDDTLLQMDQSGKPIWKISEDSPAYQAVRRMMSELMKRGEKGL
jgi:CO dehydrogenase maturation factor